MSMQFQERIKNRMQELGLSQNQLAALAGVKQSSIWSLLQGEIEKPRFILELAAALKTTPQWLLHGEGSHTQSSGQKTSPDSARKLLSELVSVAINAVHGNKTAVATIKEEQEKIASFFWPDVERGQPPSYDQVERAVRMLQGGKKK